MKRERKIFNSVREFDGQQETEKERERGRAFYNKKRELEETSSCKNSQRFGRTLSECKKEDR